ncbi:hypothetical protein XELAEV_18040055mg [Xenopus laevis]|uniref:Uncharacterized protein n=1 Tax=Xenopus laevis TaxID=8355 RepID=A0A974H8K3_XENLA|nr:hypothetical protein XELAEV_18040055mg [Xenopus laevis]
MSIKEASPPAAHYSESCFTVVLQGNGVGAASLCCHMWRQNDEFLVDAFRGESFCSAFRPRPGVGTSQAAKLLLPESYG